MGILVNTFGMSLPDAWACTVKEFWSLYRLRFPENKKAQNKTKPVTKTEMQEMILRLRQKGKDV